MRKTCNKCQLKFEITPDNLKFYDKISPVFNGKKHNVPPPTLCPDCRQQRRLAFRNEMKLYSRKCDLCGKDIISIYSPDKPYTVYCPSCWHDDKWNALDYGRPFDFNRPFFDQFNELKLKVPHLSLHVSNNENSDYINLSGYNKNCYLIAAAEYNQDCLYGNQVIKSSDCIDTLNCLDSRFCYEVVDVQNCYSLSFSRNCKNCSDSMFLYDCRNCGNCLFCTNLRNKEYHIFNKPYSKEEYEKKKKDIMDQIRDGKLEELKKYSAELDKKAVHKYMEMLNCEESLGDYISDTKKARFCFDLAHAQDCAYVFTGYNVKDLMDVAHATDVELACEGTSIGYKSYNVHFAMGAWSTSNSFYIDNVHSSSGVFGCVGLKRNSCCILNKQYAKEDYEKNAARIIEHMQKTGEWGEFFPIRLSPFGYNETTAIEYYPLTKEETLEQGMKWKDAETVNHTAEPQYDLTADARKLKDDIVKQVLSCKSCGKNYRITPQELNFYRKMLLPPPRNCSDCRHKERRMSRNHRRLWDRSCDQCDIPVKSSYSPQTPRQVFCEKCYLAEVR